MVLQKTSAPVVLLMVLASTATQLAARNVQDTPTRDFSTWSACQNTICARVEDEAEGLARVKLLRGYVSETIRLLDSLMVSMDKELVQIGQEMRNFTGPRCPGAQAMLAQIVEPMVRSENDLSVGIMEESTAQLDSGNSLGSDIEQSTDQQQSAWSSYDSRELYGSTSGSGRQLSTGSGQASFSDRRGLDHGITASAREDQHSGARAHSAQNALNFPSAGSGRENRQQIGQWSQQSIEESEGDHDTDGLAHSNAHSYGTSGSRTHITTGTNAVHTQSSTSSSSSKTSSGKQIYSSPAGSSSWSPVARSFNCRGLPGSPYAVPGIDTWCAENCARGYCPSTHCACSDLKTVDSDDQ